MQKLIIFDCDGTLVDSEYLNNAITAKLLNEIGLHEYTPERCIEEFAGHSWSNIKGMLEQKHSTNIPHDIIPRYIKEANKEIKRSLKATHNAEHLIQALQQDYKTCVASNGERGNVLKSLEVTNLLPYFDESTQIFTKIQVQNPKPAPDLFYLAANTIRVAEENCIAIEDSVAGVKAAKAANMNVIGFIGTSHNQQEAATALKNAGADHICAQLIHIPNLIKTT